MAGTVLPAPARVKPGTRARLAAASWPALALLFLAAALLLRGPAFGASVIDPDEGLYMLQAVAMLQGGWPYLAVWDMHPPGAPALLAAVHALVPEPVLALRLAGALAAAATALALHGLARRLGASAPVALAAGLLYLAQSTVLGGLATNTEILFAPFVVLAALLLLGEARHGAAPRLAPVLAAGLAAGMALLIKQVTALESSALWLSMAGLAWAGGRLGGGRLVALALAFALGAGLPSLAVGVAYAAIGAFDVWLHANFVAPFSYTGVELDWGAVRRTLFEAARHLFWPCLAALGVLAGDAATRRAALAVLPWLAGAVLAVLLPAKFWNHYFLVLMPPLSLLAALGLGALARRVLRPRHAAAGFAVWVALLAALPAWAEVLPRVAQGLSGRGDPVRRVAALAASELGPGEALYVANWHAMTYVLAGVPPPTRLAFFEHLAGVYAPLTGADAEAELARVLALPPGAIVLSPPFRHRMRPEARAAIEAALAGGYRLAGTVEDGHGPVEVWRRR